MSFNFDILLLAISSYTKQAHVITNRIEDNDILGWVEFVGLVVVAVNLHEYTFHEHENVLIVKLMKPRKNFKYGNTEDTLTTVVGREWRYGGHAVHCGG